MPQQSNTAALMHLNLFQKYQILSSLAHKSNMHKHTLSQPKLSPNDASFKTVSYIKGPSIWTITQFWVCISPHPSEKMLHIPKKPSRAMLRSLQLLYIEPPQFCAAHLSCKLKVRMVYHCWMPLEKQKHKTKRYNAEQVRWDANSWVRACCLFFFLVFFFFLFFFSFLF